MVRALVALTVAGAAAACGGPTHNGLNKPGGAQDEGAGELARASIQLSLGGGEPAPADATHPRHRSDDGDPYGGEGYAGAFGGASYAGWTVPQWSYTPPIRTQNYNIATGLSGAIEGVVTWTGSAPAKLATACGAIDNASLHVARDKGLRGVIVYIEKVTVGRAMPYYGKPAGVGGVVAKHGCALLPAAQVVTPLPTALAIHGDNVHARVRVHGAAGAEADAYDLQEGGLVELEVKAGVTEVEGDDGKLEPAWVVALDTPYFAITDERGRFRIDELAGGTYELSFWQPPVAVAKSDGRFEAGTPTLVHRTVHVEAKQTAQLNLALPAR